MIDDRRSAAIVWSTRPDSLPPETEARMARSRRPCSHRSQVSPRRSWPERPGTGARRALQSSRACGHAGGNRGDQGRIVLPRRACGEDGGALHGQRRCHAQFRPRRAPRRLGRHDRQAITAATQFTSSRRTARASSRWSRLASSSTSTLASLPVDSADSVHLQIEAVKLAFADALAYVADSRFTCRFAPAATPRQGLPAAEIGAD